MHRDAGHLRFTDSEGHELGLERNRGAYRAVIVLTNPEIDWYYLTDPSARRNRLEVFDTLSPERPWVVEWESGTLLLHVHDPDKMNPRVISASDDAVRALVGEVQRRDDVRWALTSDFFQARSAGDLPQPTVEPPGAGHP